MPMQHAFPSQPKETGLCAKPLVCSQHTTSPSPGALNVYVHCTKGRYTPYIATTRRGPADQPDPPRSADFFPYEVAQSIFPQAPLPSSSALLNLFLHAFLPQAVLLFFVSSATQTDATKSPYLLSLLEPIDLRQRPHQQHHTALRDWLRVGQEVCKETNHKRRRKTIMRPLHTEATHPGREHHHADGRRASSGKPKRQKDREGKTGRETGSDRGEGSVTRVVENPAG